MMNYLLSVDVVLSVSLELLFIDTALQQYYTGEGCK